MHLDRIVVDRRMRIKQQGHDVLELSPGQQTRSTETRHDRTRTGDERVIDLAPGIAQHFLGRASRFTVMQQGTPAVAVRDLALAPVVARLTVDDGWLGWSHGLLPAVSAFRRFLP